MSFRHFPIIVLALFVSEVALSQTVTAHKSSSAILPIRSVDFYNFTYPLPKGLIDPTDRKKTFKLRQGELPPTRFADGHINEMGIFLEKLTYGDVTGDDTEEAILFISILTGGSAIPGMIYVYTMHNNQPKLLWNSATGDRADDGFRNAFAENGQLVVELFSPIGKKGDCCPTQYTRIVYEWQKSRFKPKQKQTFQIQ